MAELVRKCNHFFLRLLLAAHCWLLVLEFISSLQSYFIRLAKSFTCRFSNELSIVPSEWIDCCQIFQPRIWPMLQIYHLTANFILILCFQIQNLHHFFSMKIHINITLQSLCSIPTLWTRCPWTLAIGRISWTRQIHH